MASPLWTLKRMLKKSCSSKGHDFSRAVRAIESIRILAAEGHYFAPEGAGEKV